MIIDGNEVIVDYNRQQLMPGWIPRRLGIGEFFFNYLLIVFTLFAMFVILLLMPTIIQIFATYAQL